MTDVDAVVVGAGPAGSAAARYAAEGGARVLLLDRNATVGVPIRCGEFLPSVDEIMATAPLAEGMEELFSLPPSVLGLHLTRAEAISPKGRVYKLNFDGYSIHRDRLDQHLAHLAAEAGAEVWTSSTFLGFDGSTVATDRGDVSTKVLVGADGPTSAVARAAGFPRHSLIFPAMSAAIPGDYDPVFRAYFGSVAPGGYGWVIPRRGDANVGLGVHSDLRREPLHHSFQRFLVSRGMPPVEGTGGLVPMSGPLDATVRGNVLLVGDAAGHVLPTSGGGIYTAMVCGRLAGLAVAAHVAHGEPLAAYEMAWRRVLGRAFTTGLREFQIMARAFEDDWLLEQLFHVMGARNLERCLRCQPIPEGGVLDLLTRAATKLIK